MDVADSEALLDEAVAATDTHELELLSSGLQQKDLIPTTRYLATLRVLRDLVSQGWKVRFDDEGLILASPDSVSLQEDEPERKKRWDVPFPLLARHNLLNPQRRGLSPLWSAVE
jgi:hypothetical protein